MSASLQFRPQPTGTHVSPSVVDGMRRGMSVVIWLVGALVLTAAGSSTDYNTPSDTLNAGGGASSSANYSHFGGLGEIGGVSVAVSTPIELRSGFIGTLGPAQPTEPPQTFIWTGGAFSQDWFDPRNWNPGTGVPGTGDTAIINSGTVDFGAGTEIGTLILSGGIVNGNGALVLSADFTWSGGALRHAGSVTLLAGATASINGAADKAYGFGTLNNQGTVVWTGAGSIHFAQGVWNNSGLFEIQNDASFVDIFDGAPMVLNNSGTVRKTTATDTTTLGNVTFNNGSTATLDLQSGSFAFTQSDAAFNNNGTARVQSGTLTLHAGGTGAGTFEALVPGLVVFANGTSTLRDGARLVGSGTHRLSGGTITIQQSVTAERLEVSGGILNGTGTPTVNSRLDWTGGALHHAGAVTLLAGATATISGTANKNYGFGTLNNQGTVVWTGAGSIHFAQGVWNNSGLFEIQNDASFVDIFDGAPMVLNNSGTVRKTMATDTTTLGNVTFNNGSTATLDLQSGSFAFAQSDAAFNNNGTARVQSGTLTLHAGGTGAGTFEAMAPGLVVFANGTSKLTNGARLIGSGTHRLSGGTITVQQSVTAEGLEVSGGILNGTGALTVGNRLDWSGGALNHEGAVTLLAGATATISGTANKNYGYGTLNNQGRMVWTGAGSINFAQGVWNNSGLLEIQNDASFVDIFDGAPMVFNNHGILRKSIAAGATTFNNVAFTNTALVELQSGILSLVGNYAADTSSAHRFAVGGPSPGTGFGQLTVSGTATLAGALHLVLANGFSPATNESFQIISAGSRSGTFATVTGQAIDGGKRFEPIYQPGGVSLLVNTIPPLQLRLGASGGSLTLSWPSEYTNLQIEAAEDVVRGPWSSVPLPNTNRFVVVPTSGQRFYRLKLQ